MVVDKIESDIIRGYVVPNIGRHAQLTIAIGAHNSLTPQVEMTLVSVGLRCSLPTQMSDTLPKPGRQWPQWKSAFTRKW